MGRPKGPVFCRWCGRADELTQRGTIMDHQYFRYTGAIAVGLGMICIVAMIATFVVQAVHAGRPHPETVLVFGPVGILWIALGNLT
jgi:hypothetical protein